MVFLVPAGLVLIRGFPNLAGYCHQERRYLSDGELIEKAALHILRDDPPYAQERWQYASVAEFIAANPDCCTVYRTGHDMLDHKMWERYLGWYYVMVELWYKVKNANPRDYYESFVRMDECGKVIRVSGWARSFGHPIKAKQGD